MAYAATTSVPVARSRAEIEQLLSSTSARSSWRGSITTRTGRQCSSRRTTASSSSRLTCRIRATRSTRKMQNRYAQRTAAGIAKVVEQEERTKWRALLLVIKAKLEAVESNIATFEDEFLAHVLLPNQQTVAQFIGPTVDQIYKTGRMPRSRQLVEDTEVVDAE